MQVHAKEMRESLHAEREALLARPAAVKAQGAALKSESVLAQADIQSLTAAKERVARIDRDLSLNVPEIAAIARAVNVPIPEIALRMEG